MKKLVLPVLVALIVAGCNTTPDGPEQAGADVEGRPGVTTVTTGNVDKNNLPAELKKGILAERSIYFDYDKYEVRPEYRNLLSAHAQFLSKNPRFKMLIQGNTDDRGSREYNLALGQKRADAIKNMLVVLGAREDQLESVSLGEEKPKNEGQNDAAWAENRRGDILYSGEY